METPADLCANGMDFSVQLLSGGVRGGEAVHGAAEKHLLPRLKLLLLSRRGRLLSHRIPPGGDGELEIQSLPLCRGIPDDHRRADGPLCLRLALPLRAGTGPDSQNPLCEEDQPLPRR